MNKNKRWLRGLVVAVALLTTATACDETATDDQLIAAMRLHRTSLEVVAAQLASLGPEARIDLRGERPVFQPPVNELVADEMAMVLKAAEVNLAVNDPKFGGVLFRTYGRGIAIDGVSSGFVYRTEDNFGETISVVDDLQEALSDARASRTSGESMDLRLAHPVDGRWGIYAQSF